MCLLSVYFVELARHACLAECLLATRGGYRSRWHLLGPDFGTCGVWQERPHS